MRCRDNQRGYKEKDLIYLLHIHGWIRTLLATTRVDVVLLRSRIDRYDQRIVSSFVIKTNTFRYVRVKLERGARAGNY